jgi:hypothetical protein
MFYLEDNLDHQAVSPEQAERLLSEWAQASLTVCCMLVLGNFACQIQTMGKLRAIRQHEYAHVAEPVYCVIDPYRFSQIVKAEDDRAIGIRFRGPLDGEGCGIDVLVFVSKTGELDENNLRLLGSNLVH